MLKILTHPNPNLKVKSKTLDLSELKNSDTQKLIKKMIKVMYKDEGIGLAAPQVDKQIRLIVIGKQALKQTKNKTQFPNQDLVLINPEILETSEKTSWMQEGCLSLPHVFGDVERSEEIKVKALDSFGNEMEFEASDFFARVIQHEVDHLNGILFIDKAENIVTDDKHTAAI